MSEHSFYSITDVTALRTLPELRPQDRQVLERLVYLAPDVAVATAAAVVRTHQPDLHEALFAREANRETPVPALLARAVVYLGLAMTAPAQGKILPILTAEQYRQIRANAAVRFAVWRHASAAGAAPLIEAETIPDSELRAVLEALIERGVRRFGRDPVWLRALVFSEAGALYATLVVACQEQFGGAVDLSAVNDHLQRVGRTRTLLADALAPDDAPRPLSAARQRELIDRLRGFGWQERRASTGRTLAEIAAEAARAGLHSSTSFALSTEWDARGASQPTTGEHYFIRPSLVPDSEGLAWWAQEERLRPLQKMLAGDPDETGLRLRLASVELLLEYVVQAGDRDFLGGKWTRTSNAFDGMLTRLGGFSCGAYGITLFPGARLDENVGVCPIVEVVAAASS